MNSAKAVGQWQHAVPDEAAVADLAARVAGYAQTPMVIFLSGDLGAGKTTFARAFIQTLGYSGYVKSPSYGLLESYAISGISILHLDLYRIEDPEELEFLALRDLFDEHAILLVEWPEKAVNALPRADLHLHFQELDEARFIQFNALTAAGVALVDAVLRST